MEAKRRRVRGLQPRWIRTLAALSLLACLALLGHCGPATSPSGEEPPQTSDGGQERTVVETATEPSQEAQPPEDPGVDNTQEPAGTPDAEDAGGPPEASRGETGPDGNSSETAVNDEAPDTASSLEATPADDGQEPTVPEARSESTPEAPPEPAPADQTGLCANGSKDPGEENTDCGGGCPACVSKVTQFGITWTFDRGYRTGKFVNGDTWVLGPIKLKGISPTPKDGLHGYEVNPGLHNKQPYDKRGNGYDASLMPGIPSASNLVTVAQGSSIVSTISNTPLQSTCKNRNNYWPSAIEGCTRSILKSAAILTVLSKPPPDGSFRPGYVGKNKAVKHNISQADQTKLRKLAPVANLPNLSNLERNFARPWIDHMRGWSGAFFHPGDNMHNYGREIARATSHAALMLQLDFSKLSGSPTKRKLLIGYLQLGIDLTAMADNGQSWPHDGGHAIGRKLPILVAGVVLGDKHMQSAGDWTTSSVCVYGKSGTPGRVFQEDSTIFYISDAEVNYTNSSQWNPDNRATPKAYTAKDKGIPEWGIRHSCQPHRDNFHWSATYRTINGSANAGAALAAHIMGLRTLWKNPAFFDFEDRWGEITGSKVGTNDWSRFTLNLWTAYRAQYGCRWTRDDQTNTYAQGHYLCGNQKLKCSWQQSTCATCKAIQTCTDYPNTRTRQADPCRLQCP